MSQIPWQGSDCSLGEEPLEDDGAASEVGSLWDHKGELKEGGNVKELHKVVQELGNVPEEDLCLITHIGKGSGSEIS